jgi:hypothetical protein
MKNALAFLLILLGCCALPAGSLAANPFLSAGDDKSVSAKFSGAEWGDEIGPKDLPLSAKVVTTRIAQAPWGSIFKISFENIVSKADPKRELPPVYYIATDDEIVLLNEEDNEAAAKKLAAESKPPAFDPSYVQCVNKGARQKSEGLTETSIVLKGGRCTYQWSHNSGHFTTVVWQKGVGLIEYAQGRGARADGYRLQREDIARK